MGLLSLGIFTYIFSWSIILMLSNRSSKSFSFLTPKNLTNPNRCPPPFIPSFCNDHFPHLAPFHKNTRSNKSKCPPSQFFRFHILWRASSDTTLSHPSLDLSCLLSPPHVPIFKSCLASSHLNFFFHS
ncbi:hypothetical protein AAZV13_12G091200 [Glycine max]